MARDLITEKEYAVEAARHSEFANLVFGVLLFTISLTCLQFNHPTRAALVSLVVVLPLYVTAIVRFPASMWTLRKLLDQDRDNKELAALVKELNRKFHGWRALPKFTILIGSLVFYALVLFSDGMPLLQWVKA